MPRNRSAQQKRSEAKDAAGGAGAVGREEQEMCAAEGALRVVGRGNGGEYFLKYRVSGRAEEMDEREECAERCSDANHPAENRNIRCQPIGPKNRGKDEQNEQAGPLESPTSARMEVRIATTGGTVPAFVEAEREQRNPHEMPGVKGADLDGTSWPGAEEAVVVAKGNAARAPMVDAVNDEQGGSRSEGIIARSARRGDVSHLRSLEVGGFGSHPSRAGLTSDAPTALKERRECRRARYIVPPQGLILAVPKG